MNIVEWLIYDHITKDDDTNKVTDENNQATATIEISKPNSVVGRDPSFSWRVVGSIFKANSRKITYKYICRVLGFVFLKPEKKFIFY